MKCKLLAYNKEPLEFDINKIISITANGNLIYVRFPNQVMYVGHTIVPL